MKSSFLLITSILAAINLCGQNKSNKNIRIPKAEKVNVYGGDAKIEKADTVSINFIYDPTANRSNIYLYGSAQYYDTASKLFKNEILLHNPDVFKFENLNLDVFVQDSAFGFSVNGIETATRHLESYSPDLKLHVVSFGEVYARNGLHITFYTRKREAVQIKGIAGFRHR